MMTPVLSYTQAAIGATIAIAGFLLVVFAVDSSTPLLRKWAVRGLAVWGAWFAMTPFTAQGHDSISAQALALLIAVVLVAHGRRIKGILDDEWWWHEGRGYEVVTGHFEGVASIPFRQKFNLLWAFLADDDGHVMAPTNWAHGALRRPALRMGPVVIGGAVVRLPHLTMVDIEASRGWLIWRSLCWWSQNFGHNFSHYVFGVADRERLVIGRYSPMSRAPLGGWLTCFTHVQIGERCLCLPFVSYHSPFCDLEFGWHPSGAFTARFHNTALHHG